MATKIEAKDKIRLAIWLAVLALDCFLIARAHQRNPEALRLAVMYFAALFAALTAHT